MDWWIMAMDVSQLTSHQAVDQPGIVTVNIIQFDVNLIITSAYLVYALAF